MPVRIRATIRSIGDRTEELQTATDLRRALWSRSLVRVDPDHPLQGIHRDEGGRAYLEFATDDPDEVRRVIEQPDYSNRVELSETPPLPGEECELRERGGSGAADGLSELPIPRYLPVSDL